MSGGYGKKITPRKGGIAVSTFVVKKGGKASVSETDEQVEHLPNPFHNLDSNPCIISITNGITRGKNFSSVKLEVRIDIPCDYDKIDQATEYVVSKIDEVTNAQWENFDAVYQRL